MRGIAVVTILVLCLAGPATSAGAGERLRLLGDDVALEVDADVDLSPSVARGLLADARKAFAGVLNRLGVNSREVFFLDGREPPWMPADVRNDPRLVVEITKQAKDDDLGYDAALARMAKHRLNVLLPPPSDPADPVWRRKLVRGIAAAVLAQTLWHGAAPWWRDGLCLWLGEMAGGEPMADETRLLDELTSVVDRLPVRDVLAASDRGSFDRLKGRALSFAVVKLLARCDEGIVPSMYNQGRLLLRRLVAYPNTAAVTREYSDLLRAELSAAGATDGALAGALAEWVRAGYPEGPAFKKTAAYKALRDLKGVKAFGFGVGSRWGNRWQDDLGGLFRDFNGGSLTWRLPWPTSMKVYAGVRGEPGVDYTLRPEAAQRGYYVEILDLRVPAEGSRVIPSAQLRLPKALDKIGYILVGATSPNGLGYVHVEEQKIR